jgi:CRISPR system Cascade subunit CasC
MFLQIHYATSYHASLLNRDDAGLAKRIDFGGYPRLRVSSQCLKRHWREWLTQNTNLPNGFRTRHFFSREVKPRLLEQGLEQEKAHNLILHLAKGVLTASSGKEALDDELNMKQPVLFGRPEADYFVKIILDADKQGDEKAAKAYLDQVIKNGKANFAAMVRQAGIHDIFAGFEAAMFGRFVTSDILTRLDAPVHVAHAFTVHTLDTEVDFFTVVDDLSHDEETGAAHANDMELGAGIFYGYVAVDVPLLVSNLTGCDRTAWQQQNPQDAQELLRLLVQAIAQVSPGAKLGSTAPYARAEIVILETGRAQPRSLANAYLDPIRLGSRKAQLEQIHPMKQVGEAMASYLTKVEQMYGEDGTKRYVSTLHQWPRSSEPVTSLPEAIKGAMVDIFGDQS